MLGLRRIHVIVVVIECQRVLPSECMIPNHIDNVLRAALRVIVRVGWWAQPLGSFGAALPWAFGVPER